MQREPEVVDEADLARHNVEEIIDQAPLMLVERYFEKCPPNRQALIHAIRRPRAEVVACIFNQLSQASEDYLRDAFPIRESRKWQQGVEQGSGFFVVLLEETLNEIMRLMPNLRGGHIELGGQIDISMVQCIVRAGAEPKQKHLSRAIELGDNDLVYWLLASGVQASPECAFRCVLDLQGAADHNATHFAKSAAARLAETLCSFYIGAPETIIQRASLNGQVQLAQILRQDRHRGGLMQALNFLKSRGVGRYLRFEIAAFLYKMPEHFMLKGECEDLPAVAQPTPVEMVSPYLQELKAVADPEESIRMMMQRIVAAFERRPSAEDWCSLLQLLQDAIPDLGSKVASKLYDVFSFSTPSFVHMVTTSCESDVELRERVSFYLQLLKKQGRQRKSRPPIARS